MNTKSFTIGDATFTFENRREKTSCGFRHVSRLLMDGIFVSSASVSYYNRTWESYEFQSAMLRAVDNYIEEIKSGALDAHKHNTGKNRLKQAEKDAVWAESKSLATFRELYTLVHDNREKSDFGFMAAFGAMAEIFCDNQADKTNWKLRMMKAGLPEGAISIPEDWDTLSEDEKERRINGALEVISTN